MRQQSDDRKTWLVIGVVVVALVVLVIVVWPHLRGPVALPPEEMPEAALPSDPREAEIVIRERAVKDQLAGIDEETRKKRHEARLKQLEEIKAKTGGG